ncbi:hypothetical protein CS022_13110 [Veronia nyctiphanis]|uniref:VOC domain-containing protein n=1 Tax=Veronia nyctiphanis TaxID=1278244 RepID=A0A4Q0YUH1_9GAMM|nr:VOC family protein [Veronia nyctiphanis]RXJ72799.1 hypothetical protein CS022_13110 [Veronia nyctiphanis]
MSGFLSHIEINVSNLARSRDFWSWLLERLGYTLYQKWEHGFSFELAGTYLVFVQTTDKYLDCGYHRQKTGLNHLAFRASSIADIDALTHELSSRGVKILYPDKHPYAGGREHYAVYFEDPDRIKVEVCLHLAHDLG